MNFNDKMGSSDAQTYCLRWNNHKANLVEILDALIKMESYVDCTLVVEDQIQFKAHRVVLAANSPYFQSILQDVPMDHCSILIPGVQAFEMRALLEYMYTGEVNVTQSQIPKIMKIAEQLEVKGLFDMADLKEKFNKIEETSPLTQHESATPIEDLTESTLPSVQSSAAISTTTTNVISAQSCASSPPYVYKPPYCNIYAKSPGPSTSERQLTSPWPIPPHLSSTVPSAAAAAMLNSVYEAGSDMNPLKRKKMSSMSNMLMTRDTPILRNVLAQSHVPDSSQPMPLVCQSIKQERSEKPAPENCNGAEYNMEKKMTKYQEPHSPYTDKSFEDDCLDLPPNYGSESHLASYVPQQQQKPEWKRYKQYTRSDILSAIECVRNGMSALQASRKYGVPSRTLYDKVKKLGITTARPTNRTIKRSPSNSGGQSAFRFGLGGRGHTYGPNEQILQQIHDATERETERDRQLPTAIPHPAAALLDPAFLQQAFESRGGEIAGREALHAMALAAAAHAAANGISTSPGANGTARSPSPMKYAHRSQSPQAMRELEQEHLEEDDEDQVEDLSIGARKEIESPVAHPNIPHTYLQQQEQRHQQILKHHQQQTGVIVPPMTKLSSNGGDDYPQELKREPPIEDISREFKDS